MKTEYPAVVLERLSSFLNSPLDGILRLRIADDPRQHVLNLFHKVAQEVPAYRQFLNANGVVSGKVKTFEDFCWWHLANTTASTKQNRPSLMPVSRPNSASRGNGSAKRDCQRPATRCCARRCRCPPSSPGGTTPPSAPSASGSRPTARMARPSSAPPYES